MSRGPTKSEVLLEIGLHGGGIGERREMGGALYPDTRAI